MTSIPPNRIREMRDRAGLTQEALANAIGQTRQAVHRLETGRTGLTEATLRRIATAVGCEAWQLLAGSETADDTRAADLVSPAEVRMVILAVDRTLANRGIAASPDQRADMVTSILSNYARLFRGLDQDTLQRIVETSQVIVRI